MGKQDDWIRINFRIPGDLHASLKAVADKNATSMNAEVVRLLRESLTGHVTVEVDAENGGAVLQAVIAVLSRRLAELGDTEFFQALEEELPENYLSSESQPQVFHQGPAERRNQ